jgi:hypothetical protein
MAWVQRRRPFERCASVKRETGGPGEGEEKDKGKNRETQSSLIISTNEPGQKGENKWICFKH